MRPASPEIAPLIRAQAIGLLEVAAHDLAVGVGAIDERTYSRTLAWLSEPGDGYLSFAACCEVIDVDPAAAREWLSCNPVAAQALLLSCLSGPAWDATAVRAAILASAGHDSRRGEHQAADEPYAVKVRGPGFRL